MGKTFKMLAAVSSAAALMVAVFGGCAAAGTSGTTDPSGAAAASASAQSKDIQTSVFQDLSFSDAKSMISDTSGMVILDVRTPEEYAGGHLANAVNIDVKASSFRDELGRLDKNKPYLVYCRSGKRSLEAVNSMKELGFTNVNNLTGGINQWQAEGGKIKN